MNVTVYLKQSYLLAFGDVKKLILTVLKFYVIINVDLSKKSVIIKDIINILLFMGKNTNITEKNTTKKFPIRKNNPANVKKRHRRAISRSDLDKLQKFKTRREELKRQQSRKELLKNVISLGLFIGCIAGNSYDSYKRSKNSFGQGNNNLNKNQSNSTTDYNEIIDVGEYLDINTTNTTKPLHKTINNVLGTNGQQNSFKSKIVNPNYDYNCVANDLMTGAKIGEIEHLIDSDGEIIDLYLLRNGKDVVSITADDEEIFIDETVAYSDKEPNNIVSARFDGYSPRFFKKNIKTKSLQKLTSSANITGPKKDVCAKLGETLYIRSLTGNVPNSGCNYTITFHLTEAYQYVDCIFGSKGSRTINLVFDKERFKDDNLKSIRDSLIKSLEGNGQFLNEVNKLKNDEKLVCYAGFEGYENQYGFTDSGHNFVIISGKNEQGKIEYIVIDSDKVFSKKDYFELEDLKIRNGKTISFATTGIQIEKTKNCGLCAAFTEKFIESKYSNYSFSKFKEILTNGIFEQNLLDFIKSKPELIKNSVFTIKNLENTVNKKLKSTVGNEILQNTIDDFSQQNQLSLNDL